MRGECLDYDVSGIIRRNGNRKTGETVQDFYGVWSEVLGQGEEDNGMEW